jgi:hypothetical protein
MNSYLGPIRRFSWLFLIAVPISLIAGMLVVYEVEWAGASVPKVSERNKPTYQATVQILVNSSANPYLRALESPGGPDGKALLDAANYLPFIIQSDRVAAIRVKKYGRIPGVVTAQALFARETNRGLNESPIPIIEVTGFAPTPRSAVRLARGTVDALVTWLAAEQNKAKIGRGGRILLQPLRSPTVAVDQKSSAGLAVLVFAVVLLGFAALAWMLDRVLPRTGSTAVGGGSNAVSFGREPMLEPAALLHGSTVASVDGQPVADRAASTLDQALSMHGSTNDSVDGGPAVDHAADTEEPEAQPASRRRWA